MLYIRGESKDDRLHNYFNGEIEFPFGKSRGRNAGQSLFISFERGGQPPFTSDVNAFKIGYRVQARNWFDRYR